MPRDKEQPINPSNPTAAHAPPPRVHITAVPPSREVGVVVRLVGVALQILSFDQAVDASLDDLDESQGRSYWEKEVWVG